MNFEQLKSKFLFDIVPNFSKAIYDTVSVEDMKAPSQLLFRKIYNELFKGEKLEISPAVLAPQDD